MRKMTAPVPALILALVMGLMGCAKAPDTRAADMVKAGDRAGALSLLEAARGQ
jgi:hypothetical protein